MRDKKIISVLCAALIALTVVSGELPRLMSGSAFIFAEEGLTIGKSDDEDEFNIAKDYEYTVEFDKATITGYNGNAETLEIPSVIDGYPVTLIGDDVFRGCKNLISITIPEGVTSIGSRAFEHCDRLTEVTLPDSLTSIGVMAFWHCENLISITIPDGVTSIGSSAFEHCDRLTEITLPDSLTSIGWIAFSYCSSLTSINIPKRAFLDGNPPSETFAACYNLAEFRVDPDNPFYTSVSGVIYSKDGKKLFLYPNGKGSEFTVPDGVTSIAEFAFAESVDIKKLIIPNSVTEIGIDAFQFCTRLTIYGYAGSYAETYANENNIPFVDLTPKTETWQANFKYNEETGILSWDNWREPVDKDDFYLLYAFPTLPDYYSIYIANTASWSDEIAFQTPEMILPETLAYLACTGKGVSGSLNLSLTSYSDMQSFPDDPDRESSDSFSYYYDGCDINPSLKAPSSNIGMLPAGYDNSHGGIAWDPVDGAIGYIIRVSETNYNSSEGCDAVYQCYGLNEWLAWGNVGKAGLHTAEICSVDINGDRSEWSEPLSFMVENEDGNHGKIVGGLAYPSNIGVDTAGNLTWDSAEGASGYHVYIKGEGVDLAETTSENVLKDINTFLKAYPNGDYTIVVGAYNESGIERKCKDPFIFTKYEEGFFDVENETTSPVETPPESEKVPESDRITSITINPAFNMKNKDENGVALDLTKIRIKAKEIYDEAGLKRAAEALGEEIIGNKHYNLLDLTLLYDGQDFSNGYEGLVQVIIPLPKGHRNKTFSCYRLTEVNGKMMKEIIPGEQTEDSYIIYLEHFSEYALVADGGETGEIPDDIPDHTPGGSPSGSRPVTNPSAPTETTNTENTDKGNDPDDPKDEEPEEPEPDEADEEGGVDADTDENDGYDDEEDGEDNEPEDDGYDDTFSKDDTDGNDAEESSPTVTPEAIARDENPGTGVPANAAMIFGFLISGAAAAALRKKKKLPRRD